MLSLLIGQPQPLDDRVIIAANGVGYGVFIGPHLRPKILAQPEVTIYLHTYVREDRLELYGFQTVAELQLFEQVLGVSGVGPKMAQALVDTGASSLISAVQQANLSFFTSVPRVGKKLAQKIIIELTSKLGGLSELDLGPLTSKQQDVIAALTALGFSDGEVQTAIRSLDIESMPLEQAIKAAIKLCSSTK